MSNGQYRDGSGGNGVRVQNGLKVFLRYFDLRQVATAGLIGLCLLAGATYLTVRDMHKAQEEQIIPRLNEHDEKIGILWEERIRADERRKIRRLNKRNDQP